jgi:hypothetical protein
MNSSQQITDTTHQLPHLDRRAFMRLSVQQRRDLLELQAIGEAIYTPNSEAMEWLEQTDELTGLHD